MILSLRSEGKVKPKPKIGTGGTLKLELGLRHCILRRKSSLYFHNQSKDNALCATAASTVSPDNYVEPMLSVVQLTRCFELHEAILNRVYHKSRSILSN